MVMGRYHAPSRPSEGWGVAEMGKLAPWWDDDDGMGGGDTPAVTRTHTAGRGKGRAREEGGTNRGGGEVKAKLALYRTRQIDPC